MTLGTPFNSSMDTIGRAVLWKFARTDLRGLTHRVVADSAAVEVMAVGLVPGVLPVAIRVVVAMGVSEVVVEHLEVAMVDLAAATIPALAVYPCLRIPLLTSRPRVQSEARQFTFAM